MPSGAELQAIVDEIHAELAPRFGEGRVAEYIPQLAHVDPGRFGLAVLTLDGEAAVSGDADEAFSIQSISKVFLLTLALGKLGEGLWQHVGREPSGSAFNSIVQLEYEAGRPRNPFINAGAILVTDLVLAGHSPRVDMRELRDVVRDPPLAEPRRELGMDLVDDRLQLRSRGHRSPPHPAEPYRP